MLDIPHTACMTVQVTRKRNAPDLKFSLEEVQCSQIIPAATEDEAVHEATTGFNFPTCP